MGDVRKNFVQLVSRCSPSKDRKIYNGGKQNVEGMRQFIPSFVNSKPALAAHNCFVLEDVVNMPFIDHVFSVVIWVLHAFIPIIVPVKIQGSHGIVVVWEVHGTIMPCQK